MSGELASSTFLRQPMAAGLKTSSDSAAARSEYGRALDADPTLDKARANLAGLKCRYSDVAGAKQEIAVVKDGSISGPDLDPEWKSCK